MSIVIIAVPAMAADTKALARNGEPPMPRALYEDREGKGRAVFLEATQLIDENGQLRRTFRLDEQTILNISDFLAQPRVNGCIDVREVYVDHVNAPRRTDLKTAIANADFVVEGVVTGKSYGFFGGVPGQLIRIRHEGILTGRPPAADESYFFVPVGEFTVGPFRFCKSDVRYPAPPEIGDSVFLLGQDAFVRGKLVDVLNERGFVRVLRNGELALPQSFSSARQSRLYDGDLREIVRHLRRGSDVKQ